MILGLVKDQISISLFNSFNLWTKKRECEGRSWLKIFVFIDSYKIILREDKMKEYKIKDYCAIFPLYKNFCSLKKNQLWKKDKKELFFSL